MQEMLLNLLLQYHHTWVVAVCVDHTHKMLWLLWRFLEGWHTRSMQHSVFWQGGRDSMIVSVGVMHSSTAVFVSRLSSARRAACRA
jgi:hypothetical protein